MHGEPTHRLSILVPVKDEVESLEELVGEVAAAFDDPAPDAPPLAGWQLILIDDGSTDGSWEVIRKLADSEPRVSGLRLRRNFGKSAALAAGLQEATSTLVATMDGDLQDDPAELPVMIARLLADDADLVAGFKQQRRDPLSKRLPSKLFNRITGIVTGLRLNDHNCGLKVGRREVFANVPLYGEMHRFFAAIAHAQGFTVIEQPVHHRPRRHGRSKFGLERYGRGAIDLMTVVTLTRYNRRPAHLFGGLGLILGTVGLLTLLYLTGVWFLGEEPIGNRPLLLFGSFLVVLSVQLASLGLIAELLISREATHEDPQRHVSDRTPSGS